MVNTTTTTTTTTTYYCVPLLLLIIIIMIIIMIILLIISHMSLYRCQSYESRVRLKGYVGPFQRSDNVMMIL